jgi:hypothetical protein
MVSTSERESSEVAVAPFVEGPRRATRSSVARLIFDHFGDDWIIPAAAVCVTIVVGFLYRPLSQPERGDPAIYEYIGQSILRGQVPYRDVIDPKGPGAMYLSALAMWAGRHLGIQDVLAVRYVYILLAGILSMLTAMIARRFFASQMAAILAFLIPLVPSRYSLMIVEGSQPKLLMMVFGMSALIFIYLDRPFWAGFCSMLSCLCWQPGLLFAGAAFLVFSRYLTSWRDLRAARVIAGAVLPLSVVLMYFYWRGALGDLWSWAFTYDYKVFMPAGLRPGRQAWHELVSVLHERVFDKDFIFVQIAFVGLLLYSYERVKEKLKATGLRSAGLYKDVLVICPVVYLAFCILNFQSSPDTIPFFPFIGLFAAWFFVKGSGALAAHTEMWKGGILSHRVKLASLIPAIVAVMVLFILLHNAITYRVDVRTLADQYDEARIIAGYLTPSDKIYVHGPAELLVALDRPNLNPYIEFNTGSDDYAAAHRPGGFASLMDEMEAARPKIVVMGRLQNVRHRAELEAWVDEHYVKLELPWLNNVYIRKDVN